MTPAAVVDGVTVRFRGHTALQDVGTVVEPDTITGLLGRNGAGKTTLLQLLAGHRLPTTGAVEVFGRSPFEDDGVLSQVCFVKEGQRYPDAFRVIDAVTAASWLFPNWDADLADQLLAEFELPRKRTVRKLSRGMNSALGIVIGLASRAPLTLFDEPYLGLDAVARQLFYDRLLADYAEHPRTVVLSTHLIEEIGDLLERVLLIDRGRVVLDQDADTLRSTALTVSGRRPAVEAFGRGREVLAFEALGGSARAVVRVAGPADEAAALAAGLTTDPTPLQRLVVELARSTPASSAPVDLEEVSR
jgi:ABC-2 type transport system ATP-binding protein